MHAAVTWSQGLTFRATAESGFELGLGASPSVGGDDDGFRPMELIAIGLAGCTAMDVISILQKKRQHVTAFEVQVEAEQAEDHPHVFTRARLVYRISGRDIDRQAVERAIELSSTRYCPAQAMLGQVMTLELDYQIINEG
jgi:putative redox protein